MTLPCEPGGPYPTPTLASMMTHTQEKLSHLPFCLASEDHLGGNSLLLVFAHPDYQEPWDPQLLSTGSDNMMSAPTWLG